MFELTLVINGNQVTETIEERMLLADFVRDRLRLTGTHIGCDTSQCGACVVLLDGQSVKSCAILAVQCEGSQVTTIEGLASDEGLHPMQAAFHEHQALQCGFCTPGMIMTAVGLVQRHGPNLDEDAVRHDLEGNICRCTGYEPIVSAILAGGAAMRR